MTDSTAKQITEELIKKLVTDATVAKETKNTSNFDPEAFFTKIMAAIDERLSKTFKPDTDVKTYTAEEFEKAVSDKVKSIEETKANDEKVLKTKNEELIALIQKTVTEVIEKSGLNEIAKSIQNNDVRKSVVIIDDSGNITKSVGANTREIDINTISDAEWKKLPDETRAILKKEYYRASL